MSGVPSEHDLGRGTVTATDVLFDAAPYEVEPLPPEPLPIKVKVTMTMYLGVDAAAVCVADREKHEGLDGRLQNEGYQEYERGAVHLWDAIADATDCMAGGEGIVELDSQTEIDFTWDPTLAEQLADRLIPRYPSACYPTDL